MIIPIINNPVSLLVHVWLQGIHPLVPSSSYNQWQSLRLMVDIPGVWDCQGLWYICFCISFSLLWGMDVAARKAEEYHAAYMKASGSLPGKIWEVPGDPWKSLIPGLDWQVIQKRQAFGALKQNYVNSIYVIVYDVFTHVIRLHE